MSKKLSIIVPVYNVEKYLRQCLDSLANQTVEDYEIIVVNDGSPDGSQAIIDEFAAGCPHLVRAFYKENGGLSDARNYGLDRAEGEYIAFVDSDDYVTADMYRAMLECAAQKDADVVTCMFMSVLNDGRYDYRQPSVPMEAGCSIAQRPEQLLLVKSLACNKIFRRSLFERSGIRFPVGQYFEDSAVVYNLLAYANRVEYLPTPYYFYRRERPGAITTQNSEKIFDIFKSCDSFRCFYEQQENYDDQYRDVTAQLAFGHISARYASLVGAKDKRTARRYIRTAFDYMNTHFPGWKKLVKKHSAKLRIDQRISSAAKCSRFLLGLAVLLPFSSADSLRSMIQWVKGVRASMRQRKAKKNAPKTAAALQAVGYDLIAEAKRAADSAGVALFADFGTLLGFVRDGGFMSHDLDLDMGVILGDVPYGAFHQSLLDHGFKLWRRYYLGSRVVEESYHYILNGQKIKCDFNYYEVTDEYSRTWLFYRKPDVAYGRCTRNVVEMNYSPITGVETLEVSGHPVPVPVQPERLLREKYGEGWTTKDTGWIYWRSPAATPLEDIGYYTTKH